MLPSSRLVIAIAIAASLFFIGAYVPEVLDLAGLYVLLLAVYMIIDCLILPRKHKIEIQRIVPERISLSVPTLIEYTVKNNMHRRIHIRIADDLPDSMEAVQMQCDGNFGPGSRGKLSFHLLAKRRGGFTLNRLYVRVLPMLGLFYRQFVIELPSELHIYPNLVNLRKYDLMIKRGLMSAQGLAKVRKLGEGSVFESLRSYSQGDPLSKIEWKATAKRSRLIVKNYQPEKEQSIVVALDIGRATAGEFDGISRLDYFINATMLLAYVALRQGDWFSMVAFSDRIESYLPPVRHIKQIDQVARALYKLQPRLVESDYAGSCRFLGLKNRKRSLLCMMTDIIDSDVAADIIAYLARFARTHLPLLVTLNDPQVNDVINQPLSSGEDTYTKAIAIDIQAAREEALAAMRRYGVGVLDVSPQQLTPDLVNRYSLIKSTGRL
ncbi:MAG TPA: DUF58 domain-containing protein [Phycisphaerae bacterium]|nr:DUF58 domain-containing protein [Phycisphaerae bacterium]